MNKLAVDIGIQFFGGPNFLAQPTGIGTLVTSLVGGAIALASVIFLFLLILGGIGMIAGAGSDNPQQIESGKKAVTAAIFGFILVFAAYWIVQLIQVITGVSILQ